MSPIDEHDLLFDKMSEFQPGEEIATAYDRWSQTYEAVENATRDLAARVLRQYPLNLQDREILEIGCGTGLNTGYLAEGAKELIAFDLSAGMLEQARRKVIARNVRFVQGDIQLEWPFAEASIDLVVCMLVLEHIAKIDHVFKEAARVLRPGGEFFVCEFHPFRQLQGRQARFTDESSSDLVFVRAFLHEISEYVNTGIQHGFQLIRLDEWRDDEADQSKLPRLVSLHARRNDNVSN